MTVCGAGCCQSASVILFVDRVPLFYCIYSVKVVLCDAFLGSVLGQLPRKNAMKNVAKVGNSHIIE